MVMNMATDRNTKKTVTYETSDVLTGACAMEVGDVRHSLVWRIDAV
jgi:uncharacterized protein Veg